MSIMSSSGSANAMSMVTEWTIAYYLLMLTMWWVMMVAMMLPSAAPMILLFAAINAKRRERVNDNVSTGIFAAGYLAAWGAFSLLATTSQWTLTEFDLLTPMMSSASLLFGAVFVDCRRHISVDPVEACLSAALPRTHSLSESTLADGSSGRVSNGSRARGVLPRLLLGIDGAIVLRRRHESVVDCGAYALCTHRKAPARRPLGWPHKAA